MNEPTRRGFLTAGGTAIGVSIAGCLDDDQGGEPTESEQGEPGGGQADELLSVTTATQYQGPNCACCDSYAEYLQGTLDGPLETTVTDDIGAVKEEYGIKRELWSCHTVELDGYVVEGHIPVDVIGSLLADKPDIEGIALPGMPAGTPGMGGQKDEPWTIYEISDADEQAVYFEL